MKIILKDGEMCDKPFHIDKYVQFMFIFLKGMAIKLILDFID